MRSTAAQEVNAVTAITARKVVCAIKSPASLAGAGLLLRPQAGA